MSPESLTTEQIRERYRVEREKRIRPEGNAQYQAFSGEFEDFDHDPWVEPGFAREPVIERTEAVIVGGGFSGMLTAIELTRRGDGSWYAGRRGSDPAGLAA